jgi:hypothetical protein
MSSTLLHHAFVLSPGRPHHAFVFWLGCCILASCSHLKHSNFIFREVGAWEHDAAAAQPRGKHLAGADSEEMFEVLRPVQVHLLYFC